MAQVFKKDISYVYSDMEKDLELQILGGVLKPGECILSENELSQKYSLSRRSSRQAISNLVAKNLLYRIPGKGTFVANELNISSGSQLSQVAVSFIVPDIDDIFISEICKGVQDAANSASCNLIIQSSNGSIEKENANIEYSMATHINGAIIFPNRGRANIDAIYKLKRAAIPFVLIDRYFRDIDTDYVVVDNQKGAFEVTTHLINLGHKRIAHLYGTEGSANDDRLDGYRSALAAAGIVFNPEYVVKMESDALLSMGDRFEPDKQGGYEGMKNLLALKKRPTAVFAGNDYQAIGAMQAAKEAGLNVPDNLALVGFDDLKFSALLEVPLTTIRQPKNEIGIRAFRILMDRIAGNTSGQYLHKVLDTELIIRKSCGSSK